MNTPLPGNALATQVAALLGGVAEDKEQRCAALLAAADSQVHEIVAAARREALASVRKAIKEERARIEQGLRHAEARAELESRGHEQQESLALLALMWTECPGVLARHWLDPVQRREWIAAAITEAGVLLAGRAWQIEHGPEWPDGECREIAALAQHRGAATVEHLADAGLQAGLRIRAERVCIDATIPGLLVQRDAIESTFLAVYAEP